MAWKIELSALAQKNIDDLDPPFARRILSFRHGQVAPLDDPRSIGEALKGARLGELWRYRVGDYRVVADIEDAAVRILVVKVDNRRGVYR